MPTPRHKEARVKAGLSPVCLYFQNAKTSVTMSHEKTKLFKATSKKTSRIVKRHDPKDDREW